MNQVLSILLLLVFARIIIWRTPLGQRWLARQHGASRSPRTTSIDVAEFRAAYRGRGLTPDIEDPMRDVWLEQRPKTGETAQAFLRRFVVDPDDPNAST